MHNCKQYFYNILHESRALQTLHDVSFVYKSQDINRILIFVSIERLRFNVLATISKEKKNRIKFTLFYNSVLAFFFFFTKFFFLRVIRSTYFLFHDFMIFISTHYVVNTSIFKFSILTLDRCRERGRVDEPH